MLRWSPSIGANLSKSGSLLFLMLGCLLRRCWSLFFGRLAGVFLLLVVLERDSGPDVMDSASSVSSLADVSL